MTEDQGTLFDKLDKQLVIPGFPRHKKKVEVRKETEAEKLEAYAHKYRPQIEISNKIKDTYSSDISNEIIKTYIDNETSYQIQNIGHITRLITAASQFVNKEKKDLKLFDLILMYKSIEKGIGSEMIKEYDKLVLNIPIAISIDIDKKLLAQANSLQAKTEITVNILNLSYRLFDENLLENYLLNEETIIKNIVILYQTNGWQVRSFGENLYISIP